MSIPLTGSGGLFTRLGHLIYGVGLVSTYQGTTLPGRVGTIQGDYASTDQDLVNSLYSWLGSAQSGAQGFASNLRSLAQSTVTQMCDEALTMPDTTYQTALAALVNYLVANSQSVQANTITVGSVTPGGSSTGNGVVLVGKHNASGTINEYIFSETITATVTRDSVTGGAVAGQESLSFAGQAAVTNQLSYLWPAGSGGRVSVQALAPGTGRTGTTNQLNNGNFESFAANVPNSWHVKAGTAGTQILQSTGQHYDGASSLQFAGDGTTNTAVATQFGVDFTATAQPIDQLAVNLWLKIDAVPAAGVLSVELVDGSGTQLLDEAGNASAFTVALTSATTSWVAYGGHLRTPRVLPAQVWLQLRLSTALSNTKNLYMDRVTMARPLSLYPGGPVLSVHSGSTAFIAGDSFTFALTNGRNGALQTGCDRLLGLRNAGLILPSVASSPTLSDALVA